MKNLALVFISILFSVALLEGGARLFWPTSETGKPCRVIDTERLYRAKPLCTWKIKDWEQTTEIVYKTNECGLRSNKSCKDLKESSIKIAAIGDSFTWGKMVDVEDIYVERATSSLSRSLGVDVALFNFGMSGYDILQYMIAIDKAAEFEPNITIIGLLPNDLFLPFGEEESLRRKDPTISPKQKLAERRAAHNRNPLNWIRFHVKNLRSVKVASHYLLEDNDIYLTFYQQKNEKAGYLFKGLSKFWYDRLRELDEVLSALREKYPAERIVIVFIPQRIQAVILEIDSINSEFSATEIGEQIGIIAKRHGFVYVDFTTGISKHPAPTDLYYTIDGHLTAEGHDLLGKELAEVLKDLLSTNGV